MLEWLTAQKTDHPMHSIEEAERLLTGLSDEPLKAIEEVASWLTTLTQAAGFQRGVRHAVIKLVDESGQPFEPEVNRLYLAKSALTQFERRQLWLAALHFWERVAHAYRLCLDEMKGNAKLARAENPDFTLLVVRVLRAIAEQIRMLHLRYVPVPDSLWQSLFEVFQLSEQAGCDDSRVEAYPGDTLPTTARFELLRAMLLEIARPDSMLPQQTDLVARVAARYANACVFAQKPKTGCIWAVDLAQPRPPELATGAASVLTSARFFGTGAVMGKVQEVIRRLTADAYAKEQRFGEEYSSQEKLVVLRRLMHYWGEHSPYRHEKRADAAVTLEAILGFENAWRKIPRALYRDWSVVIRVLDMKLIERLGLAGDPAALPAPEKWLQCDASAWGVRATVARASEPTVRIGTLCALKNGDQPWWLGVVRRLVRDGEDRMQAGIEVLAKMPATVLLRRVGHGGMSVQDFSTAADASGSDYVNILLLGAAKAEKQRHELLIARGEFIAGIVYEAMIGDSKQHYKFEELLEQGDDFDRVRFTRGRDHAEKGAQY
ncbi:MAG: hypothetical protein ABIS45_06320 [Burkholderiales bacterium]